MVDREQIRRRINKQWNKKQPHVQEGLKTVCDIQFVTVYLNANLKRITYL